MNENDYKISLDDIFDAYFDCRKNKKNTENAISFEINHEIKLVKLWREINEGTYEIGKSICFVVKKPVYREVFAADFRDRIVHHLVINKLLKYFEEEFISSSYSCRKGKSVLYGVKELDKFIKECSCNYTKDCYVLKMDIQSFFMSIDKTILGDIIEAFIEKKYPSENEDKEIIKRLCRQIINHRPELNCRKKSKPIDWEILPKHKSLFNVGENKGLAIGNLTSQIFANYYLNGLDHYIKDVLKFKYYGRYVDDFFIVSENKDELLKSINLIKKYLKDNLKMTLHPNKIYMQEVKKGVKFTGAVVKPHRIYVINRVITNLCNILKTYQYKEINEDNMKSLISSVNSYLGTMRHYKTYKIIKKIFITEDKLGKWSYLLRISDDMKKIILIDK